MSKLDDLDREEIWADFFKYKESGDHISRTNKEDLLKFIKNKEYEPVVASIRNGEAFPYPVLKKINKKHSEKKRTVFTFGREENYVLKLLAYLLDDYSYLFADNLYSFVQKTGVKQAIRKIVTDPQMKQMYSYKVDIHDYFNSVDTDIIISVINKALCDDEPLRNFIITLLKEPLCFENGVLSKHKKGIMAGVPISGFLANLYLMDLDKWFEDKNVLYARYSDDIIVFAENADDIKYYESVIKEFLDERKLQINPKKESRTLPGEKWEFLGFSYEDGNVDISDISLHKLKSKMKRKARALVRWKRRNNASTERAIRAFIRHFNRKLYDNPIHNDITWCRWYFPVITTSDSLSKIDNYMIECIRYIFTGKHTKSNYNLKYETIKEYGFQSLVNGYYKFKKSRST